MKQVFFLGLLIFLTPFTIFGQNLKSPDDFLGYKLGTQFSRHHNVVDYFKHVSEASSENVILKKYGETYERRSLYLAFISSKENIKNIESIRENNLKNIGIIDGTTNNPEIAIVWLSYNVHGNEASSTEASMNTIYTLLTEKQDWLKNTIVIIDPCLNPDGRDRYSNWFNETASQPYNIDQQASEHSEPWPGGRPNHYLFDLNRDWAWATQAETKARLKVYNQWLPHIHVDFHEQGINEPYYFAPAAEPLHEVITNWQRQFQIKIGKNHTKYFDKNGWLYFTRERFDLLYPSYGDTYPTFMGAIGMTYEQAGHGKGGLGVLNDEGEVLTLVDRIKHHTTTGLSTVEISSINAKKINEEFKKFFNNSNLKYKSYVLQGSEDKIKALKSLLDKHDIKYGYANKESVSGYNYEALKTKVTQITNSDLVISTNQPKGKMVKALLEPKTKLSDSLTYDITSWSIPYAYGLNAIASTKHISSKSSMPTDNVKNSMNTMATGYILKWNSLYDAKFLVELLKQDIKVRFTEKPIRTENEDFNRGSLLIVRGDNKIHSNLDEKLYKTANLFNQKLYPISSGYSEKGPDFGSPDIKLVNKQKIAMLSGKHTFSLSYGALWHFFEQELQYPITSINSSNLASTDLNKYNVLILPSGNYSALFNQNEMKKLKEWIKNGGKVIAISNALKLFAKNESFNLKFKKTKSLKDSINLTPYANRERENIKNMITGAIFKTKVDNTHPLAFGYPNHYFTLKQNSNAYKLLGNKNYNVTYLDKAPKKVSGFTGSEALKKLPNTLIMGEERFGKGSLVYFSDDIMFRSFWENGKLFLINAIFYVNHQGFEL